MTNKKFGILLMLMVLRHGRTGDRAVREGRQMEMKEHYMAAGITGEAVSGEEVNETGAAVAERFSRYLETILEEMDV